MAAPQLHMTVNDRAELNEKIRTALGYMNPAKIANYLGVPLSHVEAIRDKTPYRRVKDLRDLVQPGVRRG